MVNATDTLPDSRQAAIEAGSVHYSTGEPCKRGHVSPRYTVSGACVACKESAVHRDRMRLRDALLKKAAG